MQLIRKNGATSNIIRCVLRNSSTGAGLTGLTNSSTGLVISTICDNEASATAYTSAGSTIQTITTLGTYAAPSANNCRFKEVDSTNHPGTYELQFADARFAVTSAKVLRITVSGAASLLSKDIVVQLSAADIDDGVHLGLTCLPNSAVTTNASLLTSGTGADQLKVISGRIDVGDWLGSVPNALLSGRVDCSVGAYGTGKDNVVARGTFQSATPGAGVIDSSASTTDNIYQWTVIGIIGGTGAGQARLITAYTGSTRQITVVPNWTTAPDNTSNYIIVAWGETNIGYVREAQINSMISGRVDVTVGNYPGNTPQTGDSYARLGAPAGASVSADIAAKAGYAIKKNTAYNNFEFVMYDSSDHVSPKSGLTVTGQVSLDGTGFVSLTNAVAEISNGLYKVNLAQADTNAGFLTLRFTATGADATLIGIPTQP